MANSAEWKVIPLAASVNQRYADTSTDGLLTNAYVQNDSNGISWVRRRDAFVEQLGLSLADGQYSSLGVYLPIQTGIPLVTGAPPFPMSGFSVAKVFSGAILVYTFTQQSRTSVIWFDQSSVTTVNEIYVSNGFEGAYSNSGGTTFTRITDANYPTSTLNGSAYLNGYLYVLDINGSVWGTPNQNDFSTWSSTNVINAFSTVGQPIAIRSYLNEVLVFKSFSVEVFYDSGNSVGSPLLPVQQITIKWGLKNPATIVRIEDKMFWVGQNDTGELSVVMIYNFVVTPISTESINRVINAPILFSPGDTPQGAVSAFSCTMGGDKFYCINVKYILSLSLESTQTFAYNLSSNQWSVFTSNMKMTNDITGTNNIGLDFALGTYLGYAISNNGQVFQVENSQNYDQNHTSGNPDQINYGISERCRTDNFTSGTSLGKMVSGLRIRADQKSASSIRIRWSDDDYQTWSAWRSIDLSKKVPLLPGLQGTFSKRAYELEYSGSDPIRFSSLELLIAMCDI